jgi:SAM-dependent methyltransferase
MTIDERAPRAPSSVDLDRPSAARIYDWYLGGESNYAIDREFGKKAVETLPVIRPLARGNRNWLGRVVRAALEAGITQFLDLGTGIPSVGNIHDIARGTGGARVVYVDNEAVAAAHSRAILGRAGLGDWTGVVQEDLRFADSVLDDPETERLLDLSRPVCVLLVSVLHFVGDGDRPDELIAAYRDRLAPGSWLALSHITADDAAPEQAAQLEALRAAYANTQNPAWIRGREQIEGWFAGFELVEPGLVHMPDWRPNPELDVLEVEEDVHPFYWAGVGRVPD